MHFYFQLLWLNGKTEIPDGLIWCRLLLVTNYEESRSDTSVESQYGSNELPKLRITVSCSTVIATIAMFL